MSHVVLSLVFSYMQLVHCIWSSAGLQFEAAGPHKLLLLERYLRQWPLEKVVSTGSFLGAIVVHDTEEKLLWMHTTSDFSRKELGPDFESLKPT
jgi:hypothetical protein